MDRVVYEFTGEIRSPKIGEYASWRDNETIFKAEHEYLATEYKIWRKVEDDQCICTNQF